MASKRASKSTKVDPVDTIQGSGTAALIEAVAAASTGETSRRTVAWTISAALRDVVASEIEARRAVDRVLLEKDAVVRERDTLAQQCAKYAEEVDTMRDTLDTMRATAEQTARDVVQLRASEAKYRAAATDAADALAKGRERTRVTVEDMDREINDLRAALADARKGETAALHMVDVLTGKLDKLTAQIANGATFATVETAAGEVIAAVPVDTFDPVTDAYACVHGASLDAECGECLAASQPPRDPSPPSPPRGGYAWPSFGGTTAAAARPVTAPPAAAPAARPSTAKARGGRRYSGPRTMIATYPGRCNCGCGRPIVAGVSSIVWSKRSGATLESCASDDAAAAQ